MSTAIRAYLAELIGTFLLVFFGVGVVHAAVLTGAQVGVWHVAVVWAVGVSLAIYASAARSGAHLNPAITVAFVAFRRFPSRRAVGYVIAQVLGAFLAAAFLYALFHGILTSFETAHGLVRGQPGSELAAMVYGEYFPNPAMARQLHWTANAIPLPAAMLAEGIGTGLLAFFVFALTHPRNTAAPLANLAPVFIGLTVAAIISIVAPLTQAGLNPARDFGPRLFAWFAGWGHVAIPGPRGGFFTVYILAPILGALAGAAVFQFCLVPKQERIDA
jgi:glycerol uptake facilitator protein